MEILVSTMNEVPGYEVIKVHGEVYGLIVRSRNLFGNIGGAAYTVRCRSGRGQFGFGRGQA